MGDYYRSPRTYSEHKKYFDALAQDFIPRKSRNTKNLITEYDDYIRRDLKYRNWKHYRKAQYKNNPIL
ncbi:hypothetical protein [Leucothrix arctica]|uniref:Uncharacterized protein n=1 Tax=Leucothrix arctica TaxID=1481894 RepID=A0A317CAN7_9GAMM|nr:hypothetical protein [Leucothrix arctica]PWQ95201.1 hypothetical protein DKT75_12695 [Leucothrix arctica]